MLHFQPTGSGVSSYEAAVNKDGAKFPGDKMGTGGAQQQQRRGIQTHSDGMYTCTTCNLL